MRTSRIPLALSAVLAVTAFAFAGCQSDRAAQTGAGDATAAQAPAPATPEAAPQGAVEAPAATTPEDAAATAPSTEQQELAARQADLDRREAELARREADLKEKDLARREAELRKREAAARQQQAQAAPAPTIAAPAAEPEPAEDQDAAAEPAPAAAEEPSRPETVALTVPAGTSLQVEFLDTVGSAVSSPGQEFSARVAEDVVVEGLVAIPAGAKVLGTVTEAVPLKQVGGQARLALDFNRLQLPSGDTVAIDASFAEVGKNETGRDAATIGGATAGGAVLGRLLAGKKGKRKGTVLGALIGAAAGTAIASKTAGEEVEIPSGTVLELRLDQWVRVLARR